MATMPDGTKSPTVVYASFLEDGHPMPPHPDVVRKLSAAGVRAVVTGHQPHGDSPVVMRCMAGREPSTEAKAVAGSEAESQAEAEAEVEAVEASAEVLFITADTSFSADTLWGEGTSTTAAANPPPSVAKSTTGSSVPSAAAASGASTPPPLFGNPRGPPPPHRDDPRGQAVVEVLLRPTLRDDERCAVGGDCDEAPGVAATGAAAECTPPTTYLRLHGFLSDGQPIDCSVGRVGAAPAGAGANGAADDGAEGALAVGAPVDQGRWWVKARLPSGGWLLSRGEGYDVTNVVLKPSVALSESE
jgi:hypothetical protein